MSKIKFKNPQERAKKISIALKGKNNPMFGKTPWNKGLHIKFSNSLEEWRKNGGKPWNKGLKGIHLSSKSEFKKGSKPWCTGLKYTETQKSKLDLSGLKKGRTFFKGKKRLDISGYKHGMWKGGRPKCLDCGLEINYQKLRCKNCENLRRRNPNPQNRSVIMGRIEYKRWRKAVFERDNYTCQMCGKRGEYLQADHIMPWALFPELRYDVDNGRTLCIPCHKTTPNYMNRWVTKEQFMVLTTN